MYGFLNSKKKYINFRKTTKNHFISFQILSLKTCYSTITHNERKQKKTANVLLNVQLYIVKYDSIQMCLCTSINTKYMVRV